LIILLVSPSFLKAGGEKTAFYLNLSPANESHPLYSVGDADIPHPFPFYQDRAKDPVYSYDDACGFGTFLFDPDTNELEYAISYSGLSGRPIMMHFHLGDTGVSGPVIQTLFGEPYHTKGPLGTSAKAPLNGRDAPKGRSGFVSGKYKLIGNKTFTPPLTAEKEVELLFNGSIYINIHTYLNEAGEMRGQIVPCTPNP
jgi:hypothetical protein